MGSAGWEEDTLTQKRKPRASSAQTHRRMISAITGTELHCKSWQIEGAYRMLHNVLDRDVAKDPDHLIVYGGTGRGARALGARRTNHCLLEQDGGEQKPLLPTGKAGAGV